MPNARNWVCLPDTKVRRENWRAVVLAIVGFHAFHLGILLEVKSKKNRLKANHPYMGHEVS
jgi:hypothetical protein